MTTHEEQKFDVSVVSVSAVSEGVRSIELERVDGADLPPWSPGAHIDVHTPNGLVRQYSLCGPLGSTTRWRIGVLLEHDSRGGSAWLHRDLAVDDKLTIVGPRNHFELVPACEYLFIAGGIGITPLLPMLESATEAGIPWRLLYGGRSRSSMAFLDELSRYGDRVVAAPRDQAGDLDIAAALARCGAGAAVYSCGPAGLLDAVAQVCAATSRPSVHFERFSPNGGNALGDGDGPFEVVLDRSGVTVEVAAGQSIVDAVSRVGVDVETSCGEGICGSCETRVLGGSPVHRDSILSPEEQAAGDVMMVCVGRASSPQLVLDL